MKHSFLPPPHLNIPLPPKCPLALGHILAKPTDPLYALNADKVEEPLDGQPIDSSPESGFTATRAQLKEGDFSIWTKITDFYPVGINAERDHQNAANDLFIIDRVETRLFIPTTAFLERALRHDRVRSYLKGALFQKPLYIVTGLKFAYGVSVQRSAGTNRGARTEVSADATAAGVPLGAGAGGGSHNESKESTSFVSDGFLLAFELREIKCSKRQPPATRPFKKGAMFEKTLGEGQLVSQDMDFTLAEKGYTPATSAGKYFGPLGLSTAGSLDEADDVFWVLP